MKKSIVSLLVVLFFSLTAFAGEQEFAQGRVFVTPQIGLDEWATPVGVSVEFAITENIGVGGTVMFSFWSDNWGLGKIKQSIITPSVDAYYHFTSIDLDKFDLFAGASLGYSIYSWSWDFAGDDWGGAAGSGLYLSPFIGARYFLTEKLAISLKAYFSAIGDFNGVGGALGVTIRVK